MWKQIVIGVLLVWGASAASADEIIVNDVQPDGSVVEQPVEPAVINNPDTLLPIVRAIVNYLDPQVEQVWRHEGEPYQGISGALFNVKSKSYHVASVRLGYGDEKKVYGGAGLDIPGMVSAWAPQGLKDALSPGGIEPIWKFLGEHGRVTAGVGYDFELRRHKPDWIVASGVSLSF